MRCQIRALHELERISSQAFLEKMDEIIDRANANNTAYVIDHYGKEILFIPVSLFLSPSQGSQEMKP